MRGQMMKLSVLLMLLAAGPALAQTPPPLPSQPAPVDQAPSSDVDYAERLVLARRMMAEMHIVDNIRLMGNQMLGSMMQSAGANAQSAQMKALERAMTASFSEWLVKVSDDFPPIYARAFTRQELSAIDDFYGTAVGQAVLSKTPQLLAASAQLSQQRLPQLVDLMEKNYCADQVCGKTEREAFGKMRENFQAMSRGAAGAASDH